MSERSESNVPTSVGDPQLVRRCRRKPGKGWKNFPPHSPHVWEHECGVRCIPGNISFLIAGIDGNHHQIIQRYDNPELTQAIRETGSLRRGSMIYALERFQPNSELNQPPS